MHDVKRVERLRARVREEARAMEELDRMIEEPLLKGYLLTARRALADIEDFFLFSLKTVDRDSKAEATWLDATERVFNMSQRQRSFIQDIEEKYRLGTAEPPSN